MGEGDCHTGSSLVAYVVATVHAIKVMTAENERKLNRPSPQMPCPEVQPF